MSRGERMLMAAFGELPSWCQDGFRERPEKLGQVLGAALRSMADEVDGGPTFPMPPSIIAELIRERADDLEAVDSMPGGGDG